MLLFPFKNVLVEDIRAYKMSNFTKTLIFLSSVWLKGWKMIYCYPTLKVLKHEYRIARNAINFPASCMCSSTIKRFPTETKF